MPSKHPGSLYLSLETDEEFRARIYAKHRTYFDWVSGEKLDEKVWAYYNTQRKLVEREAGLPPMPFSAR